MRNASTVYSYCSGEFSDDAEGRGFAFNTSTGEFAPFAVPPVPAGEVFSHAACTVTTVNDENRAIFVVVSESPSKGLAPAVTHTRVIATEPGSNTVVASADWPTEMMPRDGLVNSQSVSRIAPTENGFVAVGAMYSDTEVGVFDGETLGLKTRIPSSIGDGRSVEVATNFDGVAVSYRGGGNTSTRDVHFLSAASGAEVGVFQNVDRVVPLDHGFLLTHSDEESEDGSVPPGGVFYFDMKTAEVIGPIAPWLDHHAQWADTVMLRGYYTNSYLSVYDLSSRQLVFHLDSQRMGDLAVGDVELGGKYLYMEKDPDNPVIDYRTQDTVSEGWTLRPQYLLRDGWVLVKPEAPEGRASSDAPAYLARGSDGGAYQGPWF